MHFAKFFMMWAVISPVFAAEKPDDEREPTAVAVTETKTVEQGETTYEINSTTRSEILYPANPGQVGIFRVRSAESLPLWALTFGVGGEFYKVSNGPNLGTGTDVDSIAETLFVGLSPLENLTLAFSRRSSSTTFGNPPRLIASLGDLLFTGMYSVPISGVFAIAPIFNFLIASDFNDLAPAGSTVSVGGGAALTASLYKLMGIPLFVHFNAIYHMPQIRDTGPAGVAPETFFRFSRFHTITLALGGELRIGSFIPFLELHQTYHADSLVDYGDTPSRLTLGTRIMPLRNKSLCILLGGDIGLGRGFAAGVPYSPSYQIIGQLSYTVGLTTTERKHYQTTKEVNIVDRKFVIGQNIQFEINRSTIKNQSKPLLKEIASVIKNNNVNKLMIVGHTDSTASEAYNLELSQKRATAVKNYLRSQGVRATMIAKGLGKRKPIASNLSASGRAKNRRVEFFILD